VCRYHLYPAGLWFCLFGCDYGLGQPLHSLLGAVDYAGEDVLFGALRRALPGSKLEIFNTDQGSQFTSLEFVGLLEGAGIRVSIFLPILGSITASGPMRHSVIGRPRKYILG